MGSADWVGLSQKCSFAISSTKVLCYPASQISGFSDIVNLAGGAVYEPIGRRQMVEVHPELGVERAKIAHHKPEPKRAPRGWWTTSRLLTFEPLPQRPIARWC